MRTAGILRFSHSYRDMEEVLTERALRADARHRLEVNCRHRPVQYLKNVLEQDHRAIKRRIRRQPAFRFADAIYRVFLQSFTNPNGV